MIPRPAPCRLLAFCLALSLAPALPGAGAGSGDKVFRAGAAIGDITPELGMLIIGGFSPTPARHINDPLHVRALALDDGNSRLAIVIVDNLALPHEVCDLAKRMTRQLTGLEPARVLIASTHTHSAATAGSETSMGPNGGVPEPESALDPATGLRLVGSVADYQRLIARRIADTIQLALNRLEPARLGWGSGHEPSQVFNRRWFVRDEANRRNPFGGVDQVRMNPAAGSPDLIEPAGPTDPAIPFIAVQSAAGRPLALLAAYSLHYVGGVPHGTVSSDYFGAFCTRLEEMIGGARGHPPFVALLANGTSGDVNNVDFRAPRAPSAPFEQIHRVANSVAAAVYQAYQTVTYQDWVSLDARYEELPLASRRPTPEMVARAREVLARPRGAPAWHSRETSYARRVIQKAEGPETTIVPLQAFRIGALGIMALPVEVFAETGLALKARSALQPAFAIELANAHHGYLPTVAQHRLGGYETWVGTNRLEIEAEPKITETLLRMVAEMKGR